MKQLLMSLTLLAAGLFLILPPLWASNDTVQGYKRPEICMKTGTRCVLRRVGNTTYWCLKSSLQRDLDGRRNSSPIRKTDGDNMGHCAKTIPIVEDEQD